MKINFYFPNNHIPLIFLGLVLFFSSCGSKKDILFKVNNEPNKSAVPVMVLKQGNAFIQEQNLILPGQILEISNLQNIDLVNGLGNAQNITPLILTVAQDSTISLPGIGKTKIAGLTKSQAELKLTTIYQVNLLKDPLFKIEIKNMKVTLLGEFAKQGKYVITKDKMTLVDIIGEAGGINNRANKSKLKIIRGDLNNPQVLLVNLNDINSLADARTNLQDGDIISLEPKKIYQTTDKISPLLSFIGISATIINIIFFLRQI
jgi:polysaccharide export outer membrane protein